MNPRMGMKVVLVRLLASERRKDVAEETGVSKVSYSSNQKENVSALIWE